MDGPFQFIIWIPELYTDGPIKHVTMTIWLLGFLKFSIQIIQVFECSQQNVQFVNLDQAEVIDGAILLFEDHGDH